MPALKNAPQDSTTFWFYYGKVVDKTKQPAMTIPLSVVLSSSRVIFVHFGLP